MITPINRDSHYNGPRRYRKSPCFRPPVTKTRTDNSLLNLVIFIITILLLAAITQTIQAQTIDPNMVDFRIDGTLPYGDIVYVFYTLRRTPTGPYLEDEFYGAVKQGILDTGASGIVLSKTDQVNLGINLIPGAHYVDVGVAGEDPFDVSEPLYVGLAQETNILGEGGISFYDDIGPWSFQTKLEESYFFQNSIIGMPAMFGKVVTFAFYVDEFLGLPYSTTTLSFPDDPEIPEVDFKVQLTFNNYLYPSHPSNTGELPILGYNPVIENIITTNDGNTSTGTWLLDTGAQLSMISTPQAYNIGLIDDDGEYTEEPVDFIEVGGVGGSIFVPVFNVDSIDVPTLNGYNLAYDNIQLGVLDIGTINERTGEPVWLDGIFGANFMLYSYTMDFDIAQSPYDNIVFNTIDATLGFDVNPQYQLPPNKFQTTNPESPWPTGDLNRDFTTNLEDFSIFAYEWGYSTDCGLMDWNCGGNDVNKNGTLELGDLLELSSHWLESTRIE